MSDMYTGFLAPHRLIFPHWESVPVQALGRNALRPYKSETTIMALSRDTCKNLHIVWKRLLYVRCSHFECRMKGRVGQPMWGTHF